MAPSAPCTKGSQSHGYTAPRNVACRPARERNAAPPQTHMRVHTTIKLDEWQIECHHTHKSVAQRELSLSLRIRPCMHATSICKFSLQSLTLAAKVQQKNVVGEVDMPQRREARRKFWSVWCVWHWADCSWTLSPAAAVSCLCQPLPPPSPPPAPPPRMTDFAWCWGGQTPP